MKKIIHSLFFKHKRQKLTLILFSFAAFFLFSMGIFSYLSSKDLVTNQLTAKTGSVRLLEPEWDRIGQEKAAKSEPGMKIEKDPYALNDGQVDIYVRLVMTVELGGFKSKSTEYDNFFRYSDTDRTNAILDKIMLTEDISFLDEVRENTNNSNYVMRTNADRTVFYFYYTAKDEDELMHIVKPNESTEPLFQYVDIPIYKGEYFGVFDQDYNIKIIAQAIPAGNYPNGLTIDGAAAAFDSAE